MKTFIKSYFFLLITVLMIAGLSCEGFNEQISYNEAIRAHNKKDFDTAIRLYKKLLADDPHNRIHPDNAIIHYDLGVAYLDMKNRREAQKQIEALKKLKRSDLAKELKKLMTLSGTL